MTKPTDGYECAARGECDLFLRPTPGHGCSGDTYPDGRCFVTGEKPCVKGGSPCSQEPTDAQVRRAFTELGINCAGPAMYAAVETIKSSHAALQRRCEGADNALNRLANICDLQLDEQRESPAIIADGVREELAALLRTAEAAEAKAARSRETLEVIAANGESLAPSPSFMAKTAREALEEA